MAQTARVATLTVQGQAKIRVKYRESGLNVTENFPTAAIAIINDRADVLNKDGRIVFPKKVVICQCAEISAENRRIAGTPVTAIDPGEDHEALLLPGAKASSVNPVRTVQKESTRPVGQCSDADPKRGCKNCCNCLSQRHRKK